MRRSGLVRTAVFLSSLWALSACEGYDYRALTLKPEVNCEQAPGSKQGVAYWVEGLTGDRLNWESCDKAQADLQGANLGCANLGGTNFSGANLAGADLGCAYARSANFSGADLTDANLRSTWLENANLKGANLTGVNWKGMTLPPGADFSGATWSDGTTVCQPGSIGACVQ